jgi:acyl-CoA thioesterase I
MATMDTIASRVRAARGARLLVLMLALLVPPAVPALGAECPVTPAAAPIQLPHLRSAIEQGTEGVIVALGSSSTQGAMASDLAHSYPAVLQRVLSAGLPQAHLAVINRGIGGQDAAEELARLDADVLAMHPRLVIWQVGANGALRNVEPAIFRVLVTTGVRKLQAAGADVILMDNQQSPRLLAKPEEALFDQTLAQVAAETGAALFSRRALMLGWLRDGEPFADFISGDGLHHNDHGYFCIAQSLAHSILAGLSPHQPQAASR